MKTMPKTALKEVKKVNLNFRIKTENINKMNEYLTKQKNK